MPVFDFNGADSKQASVCTYTVFASNESSPSAEHPIMVLENGSQSFLHHSCGVFTNPVKRTSFEFDTDNGTVSADILKIDMGFLRASENEVKGRDILETIIVLSKKLGMEVITEGVETKEQLDMLNAMGCNMYQGYYFSKPIPVEEFENKFM